MQPSKIGFAVLYRWGIHEGRENDFVQAWEEVTRLYMAERGALGSRLHRADDGTFFAYAQWPNREEWEKSQQLGSTQHEASATMRDTIAITFDPVPLAPLRDHLLGLSL